MNTLNVNGYSIDDITKAVGALAIGAYVVGYVVLSYSLSTFGLSPISLFRPRILATGICTLLFLAMPTAVGVAVAYIPVRGSNAAFAIAMRLLLLPFFGVVPACVPGFTLEVPKSLTFHNPLSPVLICLIILAFVGVVIGASWGLRLGLKWLWFNHHRRRWLSLLIISSISAGALAMMTTPYTPRLMKISFVWFIAISSTTCIFIGKGGDAFHSRAAELDIKEAEEAREKIEGILLELDPDTTLITRREPVLREMQEREKLIPVVLDLHTSVSSRLADLRSETSTIRLYRALDAYFPLSVFAYIMMALVAYTSWVFPSIPVRLGGGEVTPVTLYETYSGSLPKIVHGGMLDQSDDGFLILLPNAQKGLFIPKERIAAIYYSDDPPQNLGTTIE